MPAAGWPTLARLGGSVALPGAVAGRRGIDGLRGSAGASHSQARGAVRGIDGLRGSAGASHSQDRDIGVEFVHVDAESG